MSEHSQNDLPLNELSASSPQSKLDKKCFICKKKFGLGKKYSCHNCKNFICSRHSMKKYCENSEESIRICDICDMDQIREDIKKEILEELSKLKQNIDLAKESYKKVENSRLEKVKVVKELEEEILVTEKKQKMREEELQNKINEESARARKANEEIDSAKKEIDELNALEKEINQKCKENDQKSEVEKVEILRLKEKRTEMLAQIEHLTGKLKGSLPKEQVFGILCEMCRKKVSGDGRAQNESSVGPQGDVDS